MPVPGFRSRINSAVPLRLAGPGRWPGLGSVGPSGPRVGPVRGCALKGRDIDRRGRVSLPFGERSCIGPGAWFPEPNKFGGPGAPLRLAWARIGRPFGPKPAVCPFGGHTYRRWRRA